MFPLELTFRNMKHSDAIEAAVRERAEKLEKFFPRITSCRVIVEQGARKSTAPGLAFHVRVDVRVPGGEFVGDKEPPPQRFHEDVYVALRDAFDGVRRELEDHERKQRGDVKTHEPDNHARGKINRIFHDRGYGFIEKTDGMDVYFHRNSVQNYAFEKLAVGNSVSFVEEDGDKGPQASAVFILTKG